jgi:hypothetical protein
MIMYGCCAFFRLEPAQPGPVVSRWTRWLDERMATAGLAGRMASPELLHPRHARSE